MGIGEDGESLDLRSLGVLGFVRPLEFPFSFPPNRVSLRGRGVLENWS
jgi:hypothetical protein